MSFLLGLFARLPLRLLHALGAALGWAAYALSPPYRERLRANAALAGMDVHTRRASVAEAGRMSLEMPRLWLRPPDAPFSDPVRWDDELVIERHLLGQQRAIRGGVAPATGAAGVGDTHGSTTSAPGAVGAAGAATKTSPRGLILLTPHMGSFEVAGQAYADRFGARQPITVLYRPARQAWLRELEATTRARPALATAPANLAGVRQLMRALRRGETVGLLPDQVPPEGMGVWAPFFGLPAYTMTLAAKLARQTGAALVGIWCERLPKGAGYVVRTVELAQPLSDLTPQVAGTGKSNVDEAALALADATAINRSMEALIALKPSQYLWGYNRYKLPRDAGAGG
jgi:Kdo2-lipid IVA lauroyltransferase/acyltransferase